MKAVVMRKNVSQSVGFSSRWVLGGSAVCAMLVVACGGEGAGLPAGDVREGAVAGEQVEAEQLDSELTAAGATKLNSIATPVRLFQAVAGKTNTDFGTLFDIHRAQGYEPVTVQGVPFPDGTTYYTTVFQKLPGLSGSFEQRHYTEAQYEAELQERWDAGYQIHDLSSRTVSDGTQRYDAIWLKYPTMQANGVWRDASSTSMNDKIAELKTSGYRPLRIHAYKVGDSYKYSATFVKDSFGTNFRHLLGATASSFSSTNSTNTTDGYYLVDVSTHFASDGTRRYNAVYVKSTTLSDTVLKQDQTETDYETDRVSLSNQGYVMVDLEVYPSSTTSSSKRFSSVWVRNLPSNSSFLSNKATTGLSAGNAKDAITAMTNGIAAYDGRAGLFVEDLTNGNYIGFHADDPTYLASTTKVFIAVAVLQRVEAGALTLNQSVSVVDSDILESGDKPTTTGNQTVAQLLTWMLQESSTNATDRLLRLIGANTVNDMLNDAGLTNVGEITSICELEKRAHETWKSCVRPLACKEFIRWDRNGEAPTSAAGQACLTAKPTTAEAKTMFNKYYSTFANSATPIEYARFWRKLLGGSLLTQANVDWLADVMVGAGVANMTGFSPTYYGKQGRKGGSQYYTEAQVGYGSNEAGAANAPGDIGQYTFGVYSELWLGSDGTPDTEDGKDDRDETEALGTQLRNDALKFLKANR